MSKPLPGRPAATPAGDAARRDSAARRLARLRALSALQRDALAVRWRRIEPSIERIDLALSRARRLREHPIALGVLAASAIGLIASRRGRRLFGTLRLGWRLGLRAATVASLWRAVRTLASPDASQAPARDARHAFAGAAAHRARAGGRSGAR
ncbi:MAG: hypothetical protein DWB43_13210 [Lautropia sp.]|nr:hypothetical protein [Lautropia sp.]MCL4700854.1 hypothetical protein [Burkholderiaceae bacterium]MDL1908341.1 hypothetical protein [Betaproteobacteria bacterium PRO1]